MTPTDFLALVCPEAGKWIIRDIDPSRRGAGFNHEHGTAAAAAAKALSLDKRGRAAYFSVAGFGDARGKGGKRISGEGSNVVACRSLYDDMDVDPEKAAKGLPAYPDRDAALADCLRFAGALGLPPTIVSSGGGYHLYFPLDADISPAEWLELSAMKCAVHDHLGTRPDPPVKMDIARILRLPGTTNRKDPGNPLPVEIVQSGGAIPVAALRAALEGYCARHGLSPDEPPPASPAAALPPSAPPVANAFAAALPAHAPSSAAAIAEHCAAVRAVRDSRGNVPEPHWWAALGLLKHCEDGDSLAHEWSAGHPRYSAAETAAKLAAWTAGPTTCDRMDAIVGCKAGCPHGQRVSSPIHLGYREDAPAQPLAAPGAPGPGPPEGADGAPVPHWPAGFAWDGRTINRAAKEDGVVTWRPFCRSLCYPVTRLRAADGTWTARIMAREHNGAWRQIDVPTSELAHADRMAATLAAKEVYLEQGKRARIDMTEFFTRVLESAQRHRVETRTFSTMGWHDDPDMLVIGNRAIMLEAEGEVACDPAMVPGLVTDFGCSGTLEDWTANIRFLLDRPGAEIFQFVLCHAIGSLLVRLMGSSNWHGLPLALTGQGSSGKTTMCRVATGFYGLPTLMEAQTGKEGSTIAAMIKRVADLGSIPYMMDEFSSRDAKEMLAVGYALANGRDKERLKPSGEMATTGREWFKNSLVTSNDSVIETLARLPNRHRVEATQLRFFEIDMPPDYLSSVFADVDPSWIEHHVDNVYGTPLRPFARRVIRDAAAIKNHLLAARAKMSPRDGNEKERFHRDAVATALVAGLVARDLGLVSFDPFRMADAAMERVRAMREVRAEVNVSLPEQVAAFVASLNGRLIVTSRLGDGRSGDKEPPMYAYKLLPGPPAGRVAIDDKRFVVTAAALREWCAENEARVSDMREQMDKMGYFKRDAGGKYAKRFCIGQGSTIASVQAQCYELDHDRLFGGAGLRVVAGRDASPPAHAPDPTGRAEAQSALDEIPF